MVRANDQRFETGRKSATRGRRASAERFLSQVRTAFPLHRRRLDPALPQRPLTIVWCEDDSAIVELLSAALTFAGFGTRARGHPSDRIFFTACGSEAHALVEKHNADVFATDEYHASGPCGSALLNQLAPRRGLVLGYLTGAVIEPDARRLADLCAGKPFELHVFLQQWGDMLRRVRARTYRPRRHAPGG